MVGTGRGAEQGILIKGGESYTAPAISCAHCQRTIEGAVRALRGVQSVHVEIPTRTVTVSFDPAQATRRQIEATLDEEGYPVAK